MSDYPPPPAIPALPSFWRFPADPRSAQQARRAVSEALPYDYCGQLAENMRLVTSELVTNAVRYGPSPAEEPVVELVLWPADGHWWVAVSDAGPGRPALAARGPQACGGRGLVLVDAVCDAWAVVPRRACGKAVVAGLRLPAGDPDRDDQVSGGR